MATKLTRRLRERGQTAVHEAAHAVVGRVLGLTCGSATIIANEAEGEAGHAIIFDPWRTASDWDARVYESVSRGVRPQRVRDPRSAFRGTIIARMAGAEAEAVLLGSRAIGDGADRREIEWMATSSDAELGDLWPRYEPRMRRQTRRLVYKHREAIRRVANALMERDVLAGEEIDRIAALAGIGAP